MQKEQSLNAGYIYKKEINKRLDDISHDISAPIQKAYLKNNELEFFGECGFERALSEGIFMLKIPEFINLEVCDLFAQTFYKGNDHTQNEQSYFGKYKNYTSDKFSDDLLGFHVRKNQIEQFLLERRFWESYYPKKIKIVGDQLCEISKKILTKILERTGIKYKDFYKATGGCSSEEGTYHLTFNHYRPQISSVGLNSHKDDGFLTILRTVSPGLEVNREDKWETIPVDDDFFIINFGLSMEILTRNSAQPVSAIMHRVARQKNDRWSWGHFTSSKCHENSGEIYEFSTQRGLKKLCSSRDLINNNDYEIYNGTLSETSEVD